MYRLFVPLMLLLSGCMGRSYQDSTYVSSKFSQDQQAVIVFKIRGKSPFLGQAPRVTFDLVRIDKLLGVGDGKHIYHFAPGFFANLKVWENDYLCLMVEPGFYVFDRISWSQGNVNYFTPKGSLPNSRPVQYGAFEVKAGSVNYIGDLEVFCHQATLGINCSNKFDSAKASLEKSHPELAAYLTHTDFLPAGYFDLTQPSQVVEAPSPSTAL